MWSRSGSWSPRLMWGFQDFTVVEDGETYAENAGRKARSYSNACGLPALADDSGLEVDALDGAPRSVQRSICWRGSGRRRQSRQAVAGIGQHPNRAASGAIPLR